MYTSSSQDPITEKTDKILVRKTDSEIISVDGIIKILRTNLICFGTNTETTNTT